MTYSIDPKSLPSLKSIFAQLQREPPTLSTAFQRISQRDGLTPTLREFCRELKAVPNPNVPDSQENAQHAAELALETPNGTPNTDSGPLIARGAKKRAIRRAIEELETEGQLPDGLIAKERNNKTRARIIENGESVAISDAALARGVQRAYRLRRR